MNSRRRSPDSWPSCSDVNEGAQRKDFAAGLRGWGSIGTYLFRMNIISYNTDQHLKAPYIWPIKNYQVPTLCQALNYHKTVADARVHKLGIVPAGQTCPRKPQTGCSASSPLPWYWQWGIAMLAEAPVHPHQALGPRLATWRPQLLLQAYPPRSPRFCPWELP